MPLGDGLEILVSAVRFCLWSQMTLIFAGFLRLWTARAVRRVLRIKAFSRCLLQMRCSRSGRSPRRDDAPGRRSACGRRRARPCACRRGPSRCDQIRGRARLAQPGRAGAPKIVGGARLDASAVARLCEVANAVPVERRVPSPCTAAPEKSHAAPSFLPLPTSTSQQSGRTRGLCNTDLVESEDRG